ncbi:MAG: hypothetical protein CL676_06430 [Bdellovibrionaceae bacterium]|nr:hypothetical protein [Pseudobdellovibrionaceae bacterium]
MHLGAFRCQVPKSVNGALDALFTDFGTWHLNEWHSKIDGRQGECDIASEKTDEILYADYLQGDVGAFEELFERYKPRILKLAEKRLRSNEQAEEALQQTFYRLHSWRHKYQSRFKVAQWVFVIARSEIQKLSQNQNLLRFSEDIQSMELVSQNTLDTSIEFKERLAQTQKDLTEEELDLLHMRFIDGLAFEEISEHLGFNATNLRKKLSRLLKKLRSP